MSHPGGVDKYGGHYRRDENGNQIPGSYHYPKTHPHYSEEDRDGPVATNPDDTTPPDEPEEKGLTLVYAPQLTDIRKQVIDGDTLKDVKVYIATATRSTTEKEIWPGAWIDQRGIYMNERIRIRGIDAPETSGDTKAAGKAATEFLIALLERANLDGIILLTELERDSFGRVIARIIVPTWNGKTILLLDVANEMLMAGHADPYE